MVGMITNARVIWCAACFAALIASPAAMSQMTWPRYYGDWMYANDAAMQLVICCFGFGVTAFAKRPILWGAILSVLGIVACIAIAGRLDAHRPCILP
jgi:hypothetical protein